MGIINDYYSPPSTVQVRVRVAPSVYGPTTDVLALPASSVMMIFCGGTETKMKRKFSYHLQRRFNMNIEQTVRLQ